MRWKAEVPFGSSSPVLTEKAVVVTGSDEKSLYVKAIDRASGKELWTKTIERDRTDEIFKANDSASPSPVSDGQNVYAFFSEMGLISFDEKGEERWRHPLGPFVSFYGMSGSPVLAGDVVILCCDQQQGSKRAGDAALRARSARPHPPLFSPRGPPPHPVPCSIPKPRPLSALPPTSPAPPAAAPAPPPAVDARPPRRRARRRASSCPAGRAARSRRRNGPPGDARPQVPWHP
ncbi:MAG: PQQ-binding-like beta-propeller repeat protein [bacterium]|nr:PQQ-binding-like beta-propeller repeat protein [bacterium]